MGVWHVTLVLRSERRSAPPTIFDWPVSAGDDWAARVVDHRVDANSQIFSRNLSVELLE